MKWPRLLHVADCCGSSPLRNRRRFRQSGGFVSPGFPGSRKLSRSGAAAAAAAAGAHGKSRRRRSRPAAAPAIVKLATHCRC